MFKITIIYKKGLNKIYIIYFNKLYFTKKLSREVNNSFIVNSIPLSSPCVGTPSLRYGYANAET